MTTTKTYITDPKCAACGILRPSLASLGTKGYTSTRCKACRDGAEAKAQEAARMRDREHAAYIAAHPSSPEALSHRARVTELQRQDLSALYAANDHAE